MILHTGDSIPTTTFNVHPCVVDEVHVSGLQEGEYLYSQYPFYILKENGLFYGINETFRELYHMNQNHELIDTINLTFNSLCEVESSVFPVHLSVPPSAIEPIAMLSVVLFVTVSLFVKRRFHG